MWLLLLQNLRHIFRTRLLITWAIFSFIIQFGSVKLLKSATLQFQGVISNIDFKDALFISLLVQLFTGGFLAAVYGIWMVPYAHQGQRSTLTFTLPVSKWNFPLSYALSMLTLLALQCGILFLSFGLNFGFDKFFSDAFPWGGFCLCLVIETLAFEMLMFAFASTAMTIGQIPTFFLGVLMIFILQVSGIIFRLDFEKYLGKTPEHLTMGEEFYRKLPPIGDLVVDLRKSYLNPAWGDAKLWLWATWLLIFMACLRFKLRYPSAQRSQDN